MLRMWMGRKARWASMGHQSALCVMLEDPMPEPAHRLKRRSRRRVALRYKVALAARSSAPTLAPRGVRADRRPMPRSASRRPKPSPARAPRIRGGSTGGPRCIALLLFLGGEGRNLRKRCGALLLFLGGHLQASAARSRTPPMTRDARPTPPGCAARRWAIDAHWSSKWEKTFAGMLATTRGCAVPSGPRGA